MVCATFAALAVEFAKVVEVGIGEGDFDGVFALHGLSFRSRCHFCRTVQPATYR